MATYFVYQPEGAEPRRWEFNPGKLMASEASAIKKATGMAYGPWLEAAGDADGEALWGYLWIMLKRDAPTLQFDQCEPHMGDLRLEDDEESEAEGHVGEEDPKESETTEEI